MERRVVEVGPRYAAETLVVRGEFRGKLSPYDVPERVSSGYDAHEKRFTVRFEYLTPEEPLKPVRLGAGPERSIVFRLGKHSNKLYSVEILNVEAAQVPRVRFEVAEAIGGIASRLSRSDPRSYMPAANLTLAKSLIERERDLFTATPECAIGAA